MFIKIRRDDDDEEEEDGTKQKASAFEEELGNENAVWNKEARRKAEFIVKCHHFEMTYSVIVLPISLW